MAFWSRRRPALLSKYILKAPSLNSHDPCHTVMLLPHCHCTAPVDSTRTPSPSEASQGPGPPGPAPWMIPSWDGGAVGGPVGRLQDA
eukprot:9495003-Pyramimonas_sp.AAC.2